MLKVKFENSTIISEEKSAIEIGQNHNDGSSNLQQLHRINGFADVPPKRPPNQFVICDICRILPPYFGRISIRPVRLGKSV